jgi:hypothetical protein
MLHNNDLYAKSKSNVNSVLDSNGHGGCNFNFILSYVISAIYVNHYNFKACWTNVTYRPTDTDDGLSGQKASDS